MNSAEDVAFQVIRKFFNEQGYAHFHDVLVQNLAKAVVDSVEVFNKTKPLTFDQDTQPEQPNP